MDAILRSRGKFLSYLNFCWLPCPIRSRAARPLDGRRASRAWASLTGALMSRGGHRFLSPMNNTKLQLFSPHTFAVDATLKRLFTIPPQPTAASGPAALRLPPFGGCNPQGRTPQTGLSAWTAPRPRWPASRCSRRRNFGSVLLRFQSRLSSTRFIFCSVSPSNAYFHLPELPLPSEG